MEFNKKLQELRKNKGITQEELANALYVSRTAVSKWESGRGYPSIDSIKEIAKFFSVTVDELLSCNEIISIAENDSKQKESHFRSVVFGLLDISVIMLFFLPFFANETNGIIKGLSLTNLITSSHYLKILFMVFVAFLAGYGVLTLALQNCNKRVWLQNKDKISIILNVVTLILFIISAHPYPSVFLFLILTIKTILLIKQ